MTVIYPPDPSLVRAHLASFSMPNLPTISQQATKRPCLGGSSSPEGALLSEASDKEIIQSGFRQAGEIFGALTYSKGL